MTDEKRISRRQLLRDAAGAATLASMGTLSACFPDVGGEWVSIDPLCAEHDDSDGGTGGGAESGRSSTAALTDRDADTDAGSEPSPVVEVYREDSVVNVPNASGTGTKPGIQSEAVQWMLDAALAELAGNADNPWAVLLPDYRDGMRIGIKVNCLNGYLPTSPALVLAIVSSLKDKLAVDPATVIVWDRRLDELTGPVGYTSDNLGGAQLMGTVNSTTDSDGPGYSQPLCGVVSGQMPKLSRILTELTDVTINCPVLKTHGVSGVTAAMKNIYGIIDIPGQYHGNLQTALPQLYKLPPIRKHIRLTIIDALIAVTKGDTADKPNALPRRILAARDPVALDNYALTLINELRGQQNIAPVDAAKTKWIDNAHDLGIGNRVYDLKKLTA